MLKIILTISFIASAVLLQAAPLPLCVYGVNDAKYVKTIKKAGFNCVQTYSKDLDFLKTLAEKAEKYDLKMLIFPYPAIENDYLSEAAKWPILAFYLYDEPDVDKQSNEYLKELDAKTKKYFPEHKTAFVVGKGSHAKPYYDTADILMVDWYPVPHLPLTSFGEQVKEAKDILKEGALPNKPLWGVLQSFDWREYKQYRPDDQRIGRFPTTEEMRFMAYDALMEGAEGLLFFTFNSNSVPLPQSKPEHWKRLKKVAKELSKTMPLFESGTKAPSPLEGNNNFKAQRRIYKGYCYDIILNISEQERELPAEFSDKKYKILYGTDRKKLAPCEAAIFKKRENK